MTDHDLTQIGIEAFGARRRMQQAIAGRIQREEEKILWIDSSRDRTDL